MGVALRGDAGSSSEPTGVKSAPAMPLRPLLAWLLGLLPPFEQAMGWHVPLGLKPVASEAHDPLKLESQLHER